MRTKLYVLIACEESQAECQAFRELGHEAYSCDIQNVNVTGNIAWHIRADVTPFLYGRRVFYTQDNQKHRVPAWDLIIAHPPCTYLCKVSAVHMVVNGEIVQERFDKMKEARAFFLQCLNANAPFVAVENPLPMARAELPDPDCFIQPYWFGVPYSKKTLYWLKNLPPLMPEFDASQVKQLAHCSRGKYRSRTFTEVARAIAKQWSSYILETINK